MYHSHVLHRDEKSCDLPDCAAIFHLIVINAEQVIKVQHKNVHGTVPAVEDKVEFFANSMRILSADSVTLLYTMLSTVRGLYSDINVNSASLLAANSHEQMQHLRSTSIAVSSVPSTESDEVMSMDQNILKVMELPLEFQSPATYKKDFHSPAVAKSVGTNAAAFLSIIDTATVQLTQVVDNLAIKRVSGANTNRAQKVALLTPPSSSMGEAAVRENRAFLLTQTIIHIAR